MADDAIEQQLHAQLTEERQRVVELTKLVQQEQKKVGESTSAS